MLERISLTIDKQLVSSVDKLVDGEVFKNRSQAIAILLKKSLREFSVSKALILAGKNDFLLDKNLVWLKNNGVSQAVIAGGKNESVLNKAKNARSLGIEVEYTWDENRGTAYALQKAKPLLKEPFLLCYSDVLCEDLNLKDLFSFHYSQKTACTLVLASSGRPSKFGVAKMLGSRITDFEEKPASAQGFLVNAGVAVCNPSVFSYLGNGPSFEKNALPQLARNDQLAGYVYYGSWIH
ncbi:MAG: sugar phosphate nucleotidyltransferase [Candidatus Micrarchaeota archaeon]